VARPIPLAAPVTMTRRPFMRGLGSASSLLGRARRDIVRLPASPPCRLDAGARRRRLRSRDAHLRASRLLHRGAGPKHHCVLGAPGDPPPLAKFESLSVGNADGHSDVMSGVKSQYHGGV
jgi:hypothetical protein